MLHTFQQVNIAFHTAALGTRFNVMSQQFIASSFIKMFIAVSSTKESFSDKAIQSQFSSHLCIIYFYFQSWAYIVH